MIGTLVGASAREHERQIKRLKLLIDAGQEPQNEFSFPTLGNFHRSLEKVNEAASKLNLDSDKMNAAIFWFYKGNPITDEPAFDAIKEADLDQVFTIWSKLTSNGEITQQNASAYSNLGTLYLSGILDGTNTKEALLEKGITLKLKFLDSDFAADLKALATDETYKTTKKELQLFFLSRVQAEIEQSGGISSNKFFEILNKQEFSAKDDFFKGFIQKYIEKIEEQIEQAKNKRNTDKTTAIKTGETLFKQTSENLKQLKFLLGETNIKYSIIADKTANEILQCSIDFFNNYQEINSNFDYTEPAKRLAKTAETIAVGQFTKERIVENLKTLEEMKAKDISQAIQALKSIKDAYETNKSKIMAEVYSKPLGFNQTINWTKVNSIIEQSINWDKAVELAQKVIPFSSIEKIKNEKDQTKLNQYKSLVDFFIGKLNYSQTNKVKYLCYWKTEDTVSNVAFTVKSFPNWAKWLIGIAIFLIIVAAIWGEDGLGVVFGIAVVIGIFAFLGWLQSL